MAKEHSTQAKIQLALSEHGTALWRNNVGAYITDAGHRVAYGVGGPGGSDLIGITPVTITLDMVGQTVGVFTAIEVKAPKGRGPSERQRAFIAAVLRLGGYAGVARSEADALNLIKRGNDDD